MSGMPKEIVEAIKMVRSTIKPMGHDAQNTHGGYGYVSIDKYYTHIAQQINKIGLIWRTKEKSYTLIPNQGKDKNRTYVQVTFQYDLFVGEHSFEDYMNVTILSPIDGPQTTGQVYSYAEKVFMRVLGCVATGEKDADDTRQEPMVNPPEGEKPPVVVANIEDTIDPPHDKETGEIVPGGESLLSAKEAALAPKFKDGLPIVDTRKIEPGSVGTIHEIFKVFVPMVKTRAALTDFHAENLAAIEKAKSLDPDTGDKIRALFKARFAELKEKK